LQIEDLKDLNKYEEDLKNIEKKNRGLNKWTTRKNILMLG
jgi:flagellar motility protein MotE (MotC chaperone)